MDSDGKVDPLTACEVEIALLKKLNTALFNALTRYRVKHDQLRWGHDRPCDCELCQQAEQALRAAKGQP